MEEATLQNLRDAGCCEQFIRQLDDLPSTCARTCRLKLYRRGLLDRIHDQQRQLDALDYLIHSMQHGKTEQEGPR